MRGILLFVLAAGLLTFRHRQTLPKLPTTTITTRNLNTTDAHSKSRAAADTEPGERFVKDINDLREVEFFDTPYCWNLHNKLASAVRSHKYVTFVEKSYTDYINFCVEREDAAVLKEFFETRINLLWDRRIQRTRMVNWANQIFNNYYNYMDKSIPRETSVTFNPHLCVRYFNNEHELEHAPRHNAHAVNVMHYE